MKGEGISDVDVLEWNGTLGRFDRSMAKAGPRLELFARLETGELRGPLHMRCESTKGKAAW